MLKCSCLKVRSVFVSNFAVYLFEISKCISFKEIRDKLAATQPALAPDLSFLGSHPQTMERCASSKLSKKSEINLRRLWGLHKHNTNLICAKVQRSEDWKCKNIGFHTECMKGLYT